MIIKDLIELCPVEEIVSEIMLMCGVDESEREGISRNHTAFINNLKKKTPIDTGYVVLGITHMDEGKEYLDASLFEKCELQEFFKLQNPVPDDTHHQPGYTVCQALSGRESGGDSGRSPLFSMRGVLYG